MPMPPADQATLRHAITTAAAQGRYTLRNVRLSRATIGPEALAAPGAEFLLADLTIERGRLVSIAPGGAAATDAATAAVDASGRIALPTFVDCHTHLDKGHILPRTREADGSFPAAMRASAADRLANWSAGDVGRRMDFALRCALHHGTSALRTHLDSLPPQDAISWPVFEGIRDGWRGVIDLQAASLVRIDYARDEAALDALARRVAAAQGVFGAVALPMPDIDALLDRVFRVAERHGLDLDFHADETADPAADCLRRIAEAAQRARFAGKVLVGHCCSLATQDEAVVDRTLDAVAAAGLAVVSLPMCNLYLQDRRPDGTTPRWRGVTLLHELQRRGVPVALGSDNTRDPFHAYGDLDMLETYRMGTRILHLDHDVADWPRTVSATPASLMRIEGTGTFAEGGVADLVVFEGRNWSELLSRPESNRIVIRNGAPITAPLPGYGELDDLTGLSAG